MEIAVPFGSHEPLSYQLKNFTKVVKFEILQGSNYILCFFARQSDNVSESRHSFIEREQNFIF